MQALRSSRRRSRVRRAAAVLGVALCLAAAIAIWTLVTGHLDATGGRALASTFMAALCALTALVGATVLETGDPRRWLGAATIALSAIEFVLGFTVIWFARYDDGLVRALAAGGVLLPAFVHASLMLGRLRPQDTRPVRGLTAAAVSATMLPAVVVAAGVVLAVPSPGAGAWRLVGVDLVLATLVTLLVPIVRRLARQDGDTAQPQVEASDPARDRPNRMTMFRRGGLVHRGHAA
jgi:hypothetical protein